MQPVHIRSVLFGEDRNIQSSGDWIDHRGTCDPHLGPKEYTGGWLICTRNRGYTRHRINEGYLPKWCRRPCVRIERVHAIMLSSYIDHVVCLARDGDACDVERLRIHQPVNRIGKQLAELSRIDVTGCQHRL